MLDHIGLSVSDYDKSKAFYDTVLGVLGFSPLHEITEMGPYTGYGADKPDFWIDGAGLPSPKLHVAFQAKDRAAVDAFYKTALEAGGRDNGPPGLRPEYHGTYCGAFVLDPDGHNIEAVCHAPE
jgi:catechol 2,3-dioxygenase-like lactoylglutathione lyase family enzyme